MNDTQNTKHKVLSILERSGLLKKFSVIPLNGKKPFEKGWQRWGRQKRSINNNGFFDSDGRERNVGICCGPASGVLVIDVDDIETFKSVVAAHNWTLPKTFSVRTGKGGLHYYFAYPEDGREYGNKSCKKLGFDIRGMGGQVVAPGSIHPETKKPYRIAKNCSFADPPEWLLNLYAPKATISSIRERNGKRTPEIDDQLLIERLQQSRKFRKLFAGDWEDYPSQSEADLALCGELAKLTGNDLKKIDSIFRLSKLFRDKWEERHSSEGKTYGEMTIEKALQERIPNIEEEHLRNTDLGNAERLIRLHGKDIRFCYPLKKWFVWDGTRWVMDPGEMVVQRAKETIRRIYGEAESCSNGALRREIARHAIRSESNQRILAMIRLAESEKGIQVTPTDFDKEPHFLNIQNGTIDLKTMKPLPHQEEHYITKLVPIELDPSKNLLKQDYCPTWRGVLTRIFCRNRNLITFFKRAVGYTLTGETSEQCLFFLYGLGANGKTTVVETIRMVMGEYAMHADFSTFTNKSGATIRNDLARLRGARFVSAVEADVGEHLHETLIKQATGEDRISARFLYQEFFEFEPQFKIFLAANHRPIVKGTDNAIWRRIKLIPFNVTIPEEEQDHRLREKLRGELPGILSWALQGCLEWRLHGLGVPEEVRAATAAYREEMDPIGGFITDRCDIEQRARTSAGELYGDYLNWCSENEEDPISRQSFGRRLLERGLSKGRGHRGTRYWAGIRLKDLIHDRSD